MIRPVPIGIDDFRTLREKNFEYVDKTHFVTELIDHENIKVILLPRPRRFGKTLNLTMVRWFFEKRSENLWHLFEGLKIASAGDKYRGHFQQYPVILISFKGTKAESFEECQRQIRHVLQGMYAEHREALDGKLDERESENFRAVWKGTADEGLYRRSLLNLTEYLHRVHGKPPIVLIDEYDAPIHAGYAHGYYDKIIGFFRQFLELALKDNPHLERAILTGILRVSKESIFSGLNNAGVYTLLAPEFNTCFGFTDAEVSALLHEAGMSELMDGVRSYYNGYDFGGIAIYNPWSILQFLERKSRELAPHWVNTSTNDLIKELLQCHAFTAEKDIQTLLAGGSIEKELDENIVFSELRQHPRALWNILVFSGYLKAVRGPMALGDPPPPYYLSIPNLEVAKVYRDTFQSWMEQSLQSQGGAVTRMLDALLSGDSINFQAQLQMFAAVIPSYHDVRGPDPERFYHGLMIGLLAMLEPHYEVRSNRESGAGRPDVLIKPRRAGKPGVVLELKAARKGERTMKQALNEGLRQLQENDYAAELRTAGVEKIHQMAIAFDGKKVLVASPKAPAKKTGTLRKVGQALRKVVKKAKR
jgi:hypothetical protein